MRNTYLGTGLDKRQARREAKRDIRRRKACTMHHPVKETAMTPLEQLTEDLRKVLPDVEVEHRADDESIYVNYDFDTALVIEVNEDLNTLFMVTNMHWDRTHGVDAEHYHGSFPLRTVPPVVKQILAEYEKEQAKMQAIFDSMPDDWDVEPH